MRYRRWASAAAMLLSVCPAFVAGAQQADIGHWSRTGVELLEKCSSADVKIVHACGEYMRGILDGVVIVASNDKRFCPAGTPTYAELEAAYLAWAKANPEQVVMRIEIAAEAALTTAYPCPK